MSVTTTKIREAFTPITTGVDCVVNDMKVFDQDQVTVYVGDTSEVAARGTDYTIAVAVDFSGCTVTPLAPLTARATKLVVARLTPLTSDFTVTRNGKVDEPRLTEQLDRNVMRLQEDVGKFDRALRVPLVEGAVADLPTVATRASKLLAFDALGQPIAANAAGVLPDAITNVELANMAQATLKGRAAAAGTGDPTDLTATQARVILNIDGTLDADKPISTPTISYLNTRYEQTVHTLTGQSDPANITAALIEAGLAANPDLQVLEYLGNEYAHAKVTMANRDMVIRGKGSGATLIDFAGASGGFAWSDSSTSLTNAKAFSAVGMTVRTDDTTFRAFDARWRPRPFFFDGQLATFEDINGITNDIEAAQAWTEIIYCENAQGFSASRIDGSNRRDNESGKAIRLKTCLGGARLHDCNLNYFDDLVYAEPTAFSLCGLTGITGAFEAGDVVTTSGGATGMLMRDLGSSNFAIIPISGSFTVTHTVTGSLSGATGTIGSVDNTRWYAGEGLWVSKIEGVGVKRGVNVYNPNSVYQKFVGVFLEGIHANAKEAAVNLEYCTQVEGSTALLYTLANNAICYRLVGTDKAVVRGRVHNPGAFTGTVGIVVSAGTAGYGTNTADEIEYNIDFDNLATEESLDPAATNIRKLVKSDAKTGALADILRLKTLASDPAPVAGGVYYNSSIGSIKGSNGVAWYTITWS